MLEKLPVCEDNVRVLHSSAASTACPSVFASSAVTPLVGEISAELA